MQVRCENRAWTDAEEETHDQRNGSNEEGKRWRKKKKRKKQSIVTVWEGEKIRPGSLSQAYCFPIYLKGCLSTTSWFSVEFTHTACYSLPHSP